MARRTIGTIGTGAVAAYLVIFWAMVAGVSAWITSNGAPGPAELKWMEADAITTTKLVVEIAKEAPDPNGDSITYAYTWTRNGEPQPERSSNTVSSRDTRKGETWEVTAIPDDGTFESWGCNLPWRECAGVARSSITVTIGNTGPRARVGFANAEGEVVESFDARGDVALDLSCFDPDILNEERDALFARREAGEPEPEPELDADGNPVPKPDPCTYTVAWWPEDAEPEEGAEPPFTGTTMTRNDLRTSDGWRVIVIANDGEDDGEAVEAIIRKSES